MTDVVPAANVDAKQKQKQPPRRKRASVVTRLFGHLMSVGGGFEAGTWIVGILTLESAPEKEAMRQVIEERLLKMSRFRSKFVVKRSTVYFEELDMEDFDWDYHMGTAFEDQTPTMNEVIEYVGNLYERGMDLDKPLWKFTLIPKLDNGQAVILTVLNHALGDGVATVGVLMQILDDPPIDPNLSQREQSKFVPTKRKKKPQVSLFHRMGMTLYGVREGLFGPFGTVDRLSVLKTSKKPNVKGSTKMLAASEQISLDKVKEIKNKFTGATVNDVMFAILTIALKTYLEEVGDPAAKLKEPMRGNFPVSIRNPNKPILVNGNPNNEWQPMAFRFPFNFKSGVDAVFKVKEKVDKLKVSPQVYVSKWNTSNLIKVMPLKELVKAVVRLNSKATAMLSNVPGPQAPVHIAGKRIEDLNFYLFSPLSVYFGLITYNGKISMGVNFAEELGQDPKQLAKHWKPSFDQLYEEVMQYEGVIPKKESLRKKVETKV